MDCESLTLRAAGMEGCAAEFVERVGTRARLPLDYSAGSLRVVDRLVDGLRLGGAGREDMAGVLLGLGAYVGEVLVREAGGAWVDLPSGHLLRGVFGRSVAVRMPDGRVWNPLGRTVNRFEAGPKESLYTYFLTLHGRRSVRSRRVPPPIPDGVSGKAC